MARASFATWAFLALVATLPSSASASGDMLTLESEVHGADEACPLDVIPTPCPARWDANDPSTLGDDQVTTALFVDRVGAIVRVPVGDAPPMHVAIVPSNVTLQHPVYRELNRTWAELNDSRPEPVRPIVGFESRTRRMYDANGQLKEDHEWGIFLTVYPLGAGPGWCWDICQLDNQTYMRGSEDELRPFPNGIIVRDWDEDMSTDYLVSREIYETENCHWIPGIPCDTSAAQPHLTQLDQQYRNATPMASVGFQVNKTSVNVDSNQTTSSRSFGDGALATRRSTRELPISPKTAPPAVVPESRSGATPDSSPIVPDGPESPDPIDRTEHRPPSIQGKSSPRPTLAALAAGAATILALVAWLLYHRISQREGLDQETRRRVYEAVVASPGLQAAALAARLGLSHNTVKYHLKRLEEWNHISTGTGSGRRYFPTAHPAPEVRILEVLAQPTVRAVHAALVDQREADHSRLAAAARVSLPTVGRAVARLESVGLATQERVGKRVIVRPLKATH